MTRSSHKNRLFALVLGFLSAAPGAHAEALPKARSNPPPTPQVVLFADSDDDDDDGVPDGTQARLPNAALEDVRWLGTPELPRPASATPILSPIVRFVADHQGVPVGGVSPPAARRIGLQGLAPGRTHLLLGGRGLDVSVVEFAAIDAHGTRVELTRSHASISRVLPSFLSNDDAGASDQDALRWLAVGEEDSLPEHVDVASLGADGKQLDALLRIELWELPCPPSVPQGLACRATPLIRATADRIDRGHPESSGRSLRAEVGGKLSVRVAGRKGASIRVGGPRLTAVGPIERLRARLNVHLLRSTPGGAPAVGGDDARAVSLVQNEVATASLLWGQCGVHFGLERELKVVLVDPPPPYLVAIGCGLGLPASGGEIRLKAGGRPLRVPTREGEVPVLIADRVAEALRAAGFNAEVSRNPRIEPGALESADVLVRRGESLATVERDGAFPISSDPSLSVCVGAVDLSDGLSHFADADAVSGTLEERTLIKAYADRDPATIDVFVIPAFSSSGRVGESFLDGSGAAVHNTVLVDRAAILSGARSHVLAHELGHVLLDMPGHPDDYGVDQPTALMDSDATDPSIFGPRRLSVEECERAVRTRGPLSPWPLLEAWPLVTPAR
ncbi:MAG TPA: hypothetical protein VG937_21035 [Polyangiaceae bacterium]|nr:hypothetical protein [Polyangiaceae bacterium]